MLSNKTDLLDPLSVIIKLYVYSHIPVGAKMSINNNKISIQTSGIFQSTVRKLMGDTKNDLNIIFNPIMYACDTYLKTNLKDKYYSLFEKSITGLDRLQETYVGTEIVYTIGNLKTNMELFMNNDNYNIQQIISDIEEPQHKIKFEIYKSIAKIWTESRLNILFGHLNELEDEESDEKRTSILNSLIAFMDYMDLCAKSTVNLLK